MSFLIIGLGNPGEEYEGTRHNVGRVILEGFRKKNGFSDWQNNPKSKSIISSGKIGKSEVVLVMPETFMNKSGEAVKKLMLNSKAKIENTIVVHDDLDLPLGKIKISFNRGSGGHRGIESIERSLKSRKFARVRVGVCPHTPSGKIKKPTGEKAVVDFILGKFRKPEIEELKKVSKRTIQAVEDIVAEGLERAMGKSNK